MFPVLGGFDMKGLKADGPARAGREDFHLGVGRVELFGFHPEGEAVLPAGLQLDRLHEAAMVVWVAADIFHAEGGFAPVHDIAVHKGGDSLVILKGPTFEVVAGGLLEIRVAEAGRIVRLEHGASVMHNKERVLHADFLRVIAVVSAAHDGRDQVQAKFLGGPGQFSGARGGDIIGEHDAVVTPAAAGPG